MPGPVQGPQSRCASSCAIRLLRAMPQPPPAPPRTPLQLPAGISDRKQRQQRTCRVDVLFSKPTSKVRLTDVSFPGPQFGPNSARRKRALSLSTRWGHLSGLPLSESVLSLALKSVPTPKVTRTRQQDEVGAADRGGDCRAQGDRKPDEETSV